MPKSIIIPKKFRPANDDGYFAVLSKTVFQVGFNWRVVDKKWSAIAKAFHGFRIERVAKIDVDEVDELMKNKEIIRNGRKVLAIIANAEKFLEVKKEHGSFKKFLASIRKQPYAERREILSKMFHSIGPTGVFMFLYPAPLFYPTHQKAPGVSLRDEWRSAGFRCGVSRSERLKGLKPRA